MSIVERRNEDLFAGSTMSFGDHLEELRSRLFKAVAGLAIGCLVGFLVGRDVVRVIKTPLEAGLKQYFQIGAVDDYKTYSKDLTAKGLPIPYTVEEVEHLVNDEGMIYTIYRVHPLAVKAALGIPRPGGKAPLPETKVPKKGQPDSSQPAASPAETTSLQLVPLFVWRPMSEDERMLVKGFSTQEPFMIYLKGSLMAGVILSSPWVFYQLWCFVAAGLYHNERRFVHTFLPASIVLFLSGAAFCFFIVFSFMLKYFLSFNRWLGIAPELRINEWLGFAIFLPVGFGLSFQLPLIMLFLNRIRLFSIENYIAKWRIAVLVILVTSMILVPSSDPYTMFFMAGPLTALYFLGILLCRWFPAPKGPLEV
ncbi:MAG: twin-arginine translocase subunit TatC [Planctomycetia bacterium]|nr:twin-arginine translocase subunit TatC [Planctomycetia bacterium]